MGLPGLVFVLGGLGVSLPACVSLPVANADLGDVLLVLTSRVDFDLLGEATVFRWLGRGRGLRAVSGCRMEVGWSIASMTTSLGVVHWRTSRHDQVWRQHRISI